VTDGLDLAGQTEAHRIDIAQQLEGEGNIALEALLDFPDVGIGADLVEQLQHQRLTGVNDPRAQGFRPGEIKTLIEIELEGAAEVIGGAGLHALGDQLHRMPAQGSDQGR
jgi:hypothetical protein